MPTLAHKIRLNPTPEPVTHFKQAGGTARFVWNWVLAEWNRQWQAGGHPNAGALKKQCNAIKYTTLPWLKDIHRDAHSQPFTDLATAPAQGFSAHSRTPAANSCRHYGKAVSWQCIAARLASGSIGAPNTGQRVPRLP